MAAEISIPKIGVNVTEVRLVEWKAKEGQWVEEGSVVLVIETEKTEWSVETVVSGFLHILVKEGDKAQIEEVVGLLVETKDELEEWVKEIVKKGEMSENEGKDFLENVKKKSKEAQKDFEEKIESKFKDLLKKADIATRNEVNDLKIEIEELKKTITK